MKLGGGFFLMESSVGWSSWMDGKSGGRKRKREMILRFFSVNR